VLLHDLLDATEVLEIVHDPTVDATATDVSDMTHDSRATHPGALFCCIPGLHADGHAFAEVAVERGAVALMVERVLAPMVPQARVRSVRRSIGPVAARLHGEPSRAVPVLGVTGTNGKTTTTFFLEAILAAAGRRPGVIGTLGVRFEGDVAALPFTTPEATELQRALAELRARGADAVAMEVSSHALAEHRVDGTVFAATCFTNLSRDHLDLHGSLDGYFAAKARLFTPEFTERAAINVDDPYGVELATLARDAGLTVLTFALDAPADVRLEVTALDAGATTGRLVLPDGAAGIVVPVPGRFNAANALAAAATACHMGVDAATIARGIGQVSPVPGRFERIASTAPVAVVVDYAHTPDGIATALAAGRAMVSGRVFAVFGCGGERDPAKRAEMGVAAGTGADVVVLTSDNPRSEDPEAIAAMAARGLDAAGADYTVELDRRAAIRTAITAAGPGDLVMVLGKGAETTQVIGASRVPFDDRVVAAEELASAWS
jgi:UDP-N-acetylmuramoyl-L-alanyl-D-glutamate--2,6-diaminopimelate ligase